MLNARKARYIDALNRLSDAQGYVSVVSLILAVPIERKNMSLLTRVITGTNQKNDYRTKERPNHNGIDFNAGPHAQGYAPMVNYLASNALVTRSESAGNYGNVVDISATIPCLVKGKAKTAKVTFRFAHMHNRIVKKGDKLPLWSSFGTVGATGNATGAHKHFEVWINGTRINPHDLEYLSPLADGTLLEYPVPGDGRGLGKIAKDHNISPWRLLVDWNKDRYPSLVENPDVIREGWILRLYDPAAPEPEPPVRPEEPPHPVEPEPEVSAEEFAELAQRVEELEGRLNGIKQALS